MSRKIEKNSETHLKMGEWRNSAGQEKVGGAWASEVAKCMQYSLAQDRLYLRTIYALYFKQPSNS